ncbi:hypothetical protein QBC46DRAFT_45124 [Diplogelasinospora grovesii]|uniref:Uncharacterized protein n=1 Tax=Diplogelasinospora grovesii TaxID=303347 RepID=A0AAN6MYX7_9PEZI|nr:hypothetical protein QBC46DRAFT_45124 [Diplogelasinospora grovesii]
MDNGSVCRQCRSKVENGDGRAEAEICLRDGHLGRVQLFRHAICSGWERDVDRSDGQPRLVEFTNRMFNGKVLPDRIPLGLRVATRVPAGVDCRRTISTRHGQHIIDSPNWVLDSPDSTRETLYALLEEDPREWVTAVKGKYAEIYGHLDHTNHMSEQGKELVLELFKFIRLCSVMTGTAILTDKDDLDIPACNAPDSPLYGL